MKPRAVILLSGGLDSATTLAIARNRGFECFTLSFDYGQRHRHELDAAQAVAGQIGAANHTVLTLDLRAIGGSALTSDIAVPKDRTDREQAASIPVTYVPARNMVFLSLAAGFAETLNARDIFIGVNAVDFSGYPDCRPEFIRQMQSAMNLATKAGVEAAPRPYFTIHTPIIDLAKADIIRAGARLGVDYSLTHSCYDPVLHNAEVLACGRCDSCLIRAKGFIDAGMSDPTRYSGLSRGE